MTRRSLLVPALVFTGLALLVISGCGRTPTLSPEQTDAYVSPDGWIPSTDGWRSEGPVPPPPPPFDMRLPPPVDGWPPPPPPVDGWPPPPPPPPFDMWPPPTDGPCYATCQQKCQLLKSCGLIMGGVGLCVSQQCPYWSAYQTSCLGSLVCLPTPVPDICGMAKTCIAAPPPPPPPPPPPQADLTITAFKAVASGTTVTYTIEACNQGQGQSGNFFVDVYYDRPNPPTVQEFGDQYDNKSGGLAPGACVTTTFTRNNTPGGTYTSWAQVDADALVAETDETNNVAGPTKVVVAGPPPPAGADLVIQNVQTQIYGYTSITVRYQIQICNNGNAPSGTTQVAVYYDRSSAPPAGLAGDSSTGVPGLAAGACTTRNIYRTATPQGSYSSWAQVDPQNAVAESDESNNVFGPVKVTVGTTPGADLTIQGFTSLIYGASTVRYQMQVCNVGTGTSGPTEVHVYFNQAAAPTQGDLGSQYTYVTMLQPGACSTRNIYRSGTPAGTYTSWAQVDPQNAVAETNESNNVAGPIKVTVGGATQADLSFQSFDAKLVQSPIGDSIQYTAVVCNTGQTAATGFRVDFYYNRPTAPGVSQLGDNFQSVPYLGPSGCTTINRFYYNPPAGSYTSWAQVDAGGQIQETSESNNVAGPMTVLVGSTTSCSAVCSFAVTCGLFQASQLPQCVTWCSVLTPSQLQCVSTATQNKDCNALKSCSTPPPPPPPPPPGVCPDLCSYLINTCNILPSNQYWTCVGACQNLDPAKIQCAQSAKNQGQCMQVILCMF